jgi:hypothetical protein
MTFTSEKYKPLDNRFNPRAPKPDLKSCLIWFIAFVVIIGLIVGLSIIFGK